MNQLTDKGFINREEELEFLNDLHKKPGAQLIVIYGRRRAGKTELVKQFSKNKKHIYFLCEKSSEIMNIKKMSEQMAKYLNNEIILESQLKEWESLFKLFLDLKRGQEKIVVVFDEFPFLIELNRGIPSIFQRIWELLLKDRRDITLVLIGSSISMMETEVLGYNSPLYGRRTGQWKVSEMKLNHIRKFLPQARFEDVLYTYGVAGGIPLYLSLFDDSKSIMDNISYLFAWKGGFLYEEAENILRQEFREPKNYKLILRAISEGKRRMGEIANETGIDKTAISRYIEILENLDLVGHELPLFAAPRAKNRLHFIKDNYFNFYFRFIYPMKSEIEDGRKKEVMSRIGRELDNYFGHIFEDICIKTVYEFKMFNFTKIGRQWGKIPRAEKGKNTYEIDIVAVNEQIQEILFAECKWKSKVNAKKIVRELKEKAEYVRWNNDKKKVHFAIFAKSFKNKDVEGVKLYDLKDLEKVFE